MSFHLWLLVIGGLLLGVAFLHPAVQRLPITTTIIYLFVGLGLGPLGLGVLRIDPLEKTSLLHHAAEVAVIISLFTVGLKLPLRRHDPALWPPLGLAIASMILTVAFVAAIGVAWMGLSLGAAILLGAVLAPTDPVLASDVQLRDDKDRDRVRMTLSAESGLNDGTAFPFVFLGLGLLGLHDLGEFGWRWLAVDVLWAAGGGLGIGWLLGYGTGQLIMLLHQRTGHRLSLQEYLVIGLIGVSYGVAVQVHAYGFLAVFAAGVALRSVERRAVAHAEAKSADPRSANPSGRGGGILISGALIATNEQLERILEVGLVTLVGASLAYIHAQAETWWFTALLFVVLRPLACAPVLAVARFSRIESAAVAWFGIRGIGSVYYIMYAVDHGLPSELAERLVSLTLSVIALSVITHGISVTPLLDRYERRVSKARRD